MISAQLRKTFLSLIPKKSTESPISSSLHHHFFFSTLKTPRNYNPVAFFLKENGFSDTQSEKLMKNKNQLRLSDLQKSIKPKLKVFHELGFSNSETAEIITREPSILSTSITTRLIPSLSFLLNLYGSPQQIVKVLRKTRRLLTTDYETNLSPNIEFLKSRNLPLQRILCLLRRLPTSFLVNHKNFRNRVEEFEALGMDSSSKMFIYALGIFVSQRTEVWEIKLQTLRDLSFTETEILNTLKKFPLVFVTSSDKIKRVAEALLGSSKYDISSIKHNPMSLSRSLEKRVKPRLEILEILEKRKLIVNWPTLRNLYLNTDKRFHQDFVDPFPGVFNSLESV